MDDMKWFKSLAAELLETIPFHTGEVHAQDTSDRKEYETYELMTTQLMFNIPTDVSEWATAIGPNQTWADEHFAERVSGLPLNPAPSHERWPFAQSNNTQHTDNRGKFSHTYPERFWPRYAGEEWRLSHGISKVGIRFEYGDLNDMVDLLVRNPLTRQAYLPVWFPEDLCAAVIGKRVPCSIGYHFMFREGKLHCWYTMRSCDFVRYLRDDIYMAGRLVQWVCEEANNRLDKQAGRMGEYGQFIPGTLHMIISSLHAFRGDKWILERMVSELK